MGQIEAFRTLSSGLELIQDNGAYTKLGVTLEISKHIIQVPYHSDENLKKLAELKKRNIVTSLLKPGIAVALLSSEDIEIHDPLRPHNNGSSAEYAIDHHRYFAADGKENILYVSRIKPNGSTSKHLHEIGTNGNGVFEHIFILDGEGTIGGENDRRPMEPYELVSPFSDHVIIAGQEGLSLVILTENVAGIPDDKIHIHKAS